MHLRVVSHNPGFHSEHVLIYDGSFEGLLTAVFEIYEYKFSAPVIFKEGAAHTSLFGKVHQVITSTDKADRVAKKIKTCISSSAARHLHQAFLSEASGIENIIYRYIDAVVVKQTTNENDPANPNVYDVYSIAKKVSRERHRMTAFIRFQKTSDELYFCMIEPDFNVLPLISKHFKDRFTDQRWLIYDTRRNYGLSYDLHSVQEVQLTPHANGAAISISVDKDEALYQALWKQYFKSTFIQARKNTKLHLQHVPRRYWRFLTEKQY